MQTVPFKKLGNPFDLDNKAQTLSVIDELSKSAEQRKLEKQIKDLVDAHINKLMGITPAVPKKLSFLEQCTLELEMAKWKKKYFPKDYENNLKIPYAPLNIEKSYLDKNCFIWGYNFLISQKQHNDLSTIFFNV